MDNRTKICAVVVTYNRKEKLKRCIKCLLEQRDVSCNIIIVDNASSDGTKEMIMDFFSKEGIFYYNTGTNLGGAGGFEYGVREAILKGYKYIWIMDDDTWPDKNALKELFVADKELNGNWGFLSSIAYWTDGTLCKANIQKKGLFKFAKKNDYQSKICRVQFASFVSLLVKRDVVCEIGLPIGEYFIWTDDYEYTGRISKDYPGYMVCSSKVIHAMNTHMKASIIKDDISRAERYKYLFRNDVHCYRQYGIAGWLYIILKDVYMVVNVILNSSDKKNRLSIIVNGFIRGCLFSPKVNYVK